MQAGALADLHAELSGMISDLTARYATKQDLQLLQAQIENQISSLKADLTCRFVALTAFLGAVLSLINIFVA